ncbi:hypothetical protein EPI10_005640 [Gossypium australe]|uniref:Uncharacterized protein n=1 Tax=Gossypium australe TaxID=47621 RepID=A0A5B6WNM3_9ROSI|nr:hypothetical protein EPI10_005640 [Gossypium australe]
MQVIHDSWTGLERIRGGHAEDHSKFGRGVWAGGETEAFTNKHKRSNNNRATRVTSITSPLPKHHKIDS